MESGGVWLFDTSQDIIYSVRQCNYTSPNWHLRIHVILNGLFIDKTGSQNCHPVFIMCGLIVNVLQPFIVSSDYIAFVILKS